MADYAVATAFTGRDQVTPVFDRMSQSADRFKDRTSSAFRNSTKEGYKFATIVKGILAANLIRGGIDKVSQGLQRVGTDFLTFDDTIIGAVARFDDIGPGAKNAADMIGLLGRQTRQSVIGTRFAAVDAAKSINELAKASYDSKTAIGILPNMMAFATANQEDLAEATSMSSDLLGAFNLRSKDTQLQLKNHIALNDKLTKSALLSTGGLRDMFESLKQTAPIGNKMKIPIDQLMAMTVVLSNAGIKGDLAATAIKRAAMNIYAGGMAAEFMANGIDIADKKTGKLKDFPTILADIGNKLKPLREDVRLPILRKIFGMYGLAGSYQLMDQLDAIGEMQEKIKNASGTTQAVAGFQNMSTFAKLVAVGNAALEKGFQILEAFNGDGKKGLEGLINRINRFDVAPLVQGLSAAGNVFGALWKVVSPFMPVLPYLVAGFYGIGIASKIIAGAKVAHAIGLATIAMTAGLGPVTAMGTAFGGLAASLTATQVAMVGVVAAFAWWEAGKSLFTGKDNAISQLAQNLGIVPKLNHDAEGRVTSGAYAPNAATAGNQQWNGQLNINGAPPGSTLTTQRGTPNFNAAMLGANP